MSKPWEQKWSVVPTPAWTLGKNWKEIHAEDGHSVIHAGSYISWRGDEQESHSGVYMTDEVADFVSAAPDMARAGLDVVQGVLAGAAPVLGPVSADEMVARGQSVTISAQQFAALVASLRKAGAL